jgi:hypothetical protein
MELSHKQKWGKSIIDIAKDEGVTRTQIYNRIETHGTPYKAEISSIDPVVKAKKPKKPKKNYYTKKPNKYILKWGKSLADLAKDEGVGEGVIRDRIKIHGTPYRKKPVPLYFIFVKGWGDSEDQYYPISKGNTIEECVDNITDTGFDMEIQYYILDTQTLDIVEYNTLNEGVYA